MIDDRLLLPDSKDEVFPELGVDGSCKSRHCSITEPVKDPALLVPTWEAHVNRWLDWLDWPIGRLLSYLNLQCRILGIMLLYLPIAIALPPRGDTSVASGLCFIAFDSADLQNKHNVSFCRYDRA